MHECFVNISLKHNVIACKPPLSPLKFITTHFTTTHPTTPQHNTPYSITTHHNTRYHTTTRRLGVGSWDSLWVPDTFLRNEKRASFHEVTRHNRLLRLDCHGGVWYVIRFVFFSFCCFFSQSIFKSSLLKSDLKTAWKLLELTL